MITYGAILVVLFLLEIVYFRIADRFNIIDKPNQRSSHSRIVLRGGGRHLHRRTVGVEYHERV